MREIPHYSASDIFAIGMEKTISALKTSAAINDQPISREHIPLAQGEDFLLMPAISSTDLNRAFIFSDSRVKIRMPFFIQYCFTKRTGLRPQHE